LSPNEPVAYYINGNIDLSSLIAQQWSYCNVIVLGFVYTADIASKVTKYDFSQYPNVAALPPFAQFVSNAWGLSAGGSSPYTMNTTLIAQLQTWQSVEPLRRKIMFGIGGESEAPNYLVWSQSQNNVPNVQVVAAGVMYFLQNVQAQYPALKFAGVDFDYEDSAALGYYGPPTATTYSGTTLMIQLTRAVRAVLPNIMLTHAPQSPYLANSPVSGQTPAIIVGGSGYGSYLYILSQVAPLLSGLFIQFYNQNSSVQGAGPDFAILEGLYMGQTVTSSVPGVPPTFTVPPHAPGWAVPWAVQQLPTSRRVARVCGTSTIQRHKFDVLDSAFGRHGASQRKCRGVVPSDGSIWPKGSSVPAAGCQRPSWRTYRRTFCGVHCPALQQLQQRQHC
jgi:hypothetical protein